MIDALEDRGVPVTLVHTGQHLDSAVSGVFFEELGPAVQLGGDTWLRGRRIRKTSEVSPCDGPSRRT